MTELDPQVEQQLAALSSEDFAALVARVRPPSFTDQLIAAASKFISGERLDAFVAGANPKAFAAENGDIDEAKVTAHLTTLFGQPNGQQQSGHRSWGQTSSPPPLRFPGDGGREEAARRAGREFVAGGQESSAWDGPGAAGRQEAAKRNGNNGIAGG